MEYTCPICYDNINLIYETPCGHKFCYLCLKTSFLANIKTCPLCRSTLPDNLPESASSNHQINIPNICWAYTGRNNGIWYYDISSNEIIEDGYQKYLIDNTNHKLNITIIGKSYIIDFNKMTQKADGGGLRKIARININDKNDEYLFKGMSGLQLK